MTTTTPSIASLLKYSELQMAAEAFLVIGGVPVDSPARLAEALVAGNKHASQFTLTEAQEFAKHWVVITQKENTGTGFSGTLFQCIKDDPSTGAKVGEQVISFRSTEFVDDAARDSLATNTLEIKNEGFAFGQIVDMEDWYAQLVLDGKIADPAQLSATGYSLGGHLATAFNLLRRESGTTLQEVVTFNGAGVGTWENIPSLTALIQLFRSLQTIGAGESAAEHIGITDPQLASLYNRVRDVVNHGGSIVSTDKEQLLAWSAYGKSEGANDLSAKIRGEQCDFILNALDGIAAIRDEVARLPNVVSGNNVQPNTPNAVGLSAIDQDSLDYQMAIQLSGQYTNTGSIIGNGLRAFLGKTYGSPALQNQFDVIGATSPSAVANSNHHWGTDVQIFIEDQPLFRGEFIEKAIAESWANKSVTLLVNGYKYNGFGDTHSLPLLVDSLLTQNTILQLIPENKRPAAAKLLDVILKEASFLKSAATPGTQGKAEGDVLENVVNALAELALGPGRGTLTSSTDGNTWWDPTARGALHSLLYEVVEKSKLVQNAATLGLDLQRSGSTLYNTARGDFGAYMALHSLSPFALTGLTTEKATGNVAGTLYNTWLTDSSVQDATKRAITDTWLQQRGDFLDRKNWLGLKDFNPVNPQHKNDSPDTIFGGESQHPYLNASDKFVDVASGYTIAYGINFDNTRLHYFGGNENDTATGNLVEDWLFGGNGNDQLTGGDGTDTFRFESGWGHDVILDATTADTIEIDGVELTATGVLRKGDGVYTTPDGATTFVLRTEGIKQSLEIIVKDKGSITLQNWVEGAGGLSFGSAQNYSINTINTLTGTGNDDSLVFPDRVATTANAGDGNDTVGYAQDTYLFGDEQLGNLTLFSSQTDVLSAGQGDDWLYAGDGKDILQGGTGNDVLAGGILASSYWLNRPGFTEATPNAFIDTQFFEARRDQDSNVIDAGSGNDSVSAGWGDDIVRGGDDSDTVTGQAGDDLLFGDEGNDTLIGDGGTKLIWDQAYWDLIHSEAGMPLTPSDYVWDRNWTPGYLHGADTLDGGAGNDYLLGLGGDDLLLGGTGDDLMLGDTKNSTSQTESLDTTPIEVRGDDWLDGQAGDDQAVGAGGHLLAPTLYLGLLLRRQNAHAQCVKTLAPIASAQPQDTHLAFERLRFRRVTTSIYSSNPRLALLKSTLKKFGFAPEGVLRAHAMQGPKKFSDVHILGCLDEEVRRSEGVMRHAQRHGPWPEMKALFG